MDKAMLRRQLEAQAAALEEGGPQLCGRLLDACCALVEAAREEAPDPAPLADPEREELLAPALALLDKVNTLALPYAAPKPGSGREALEEGAKALEAQMAETEDLKRQLADQNRQRKALEAEALSLRQDLEQAREALEEARTARRSLERMGEDYTPQKLQALKEENEGLLTRLQERREEANRLKAQREAHQEEAASLERELEELRREVDAQPAHRAQLVEERGALLSRLEALQEAETACSPQRQAQLQEQIRQLEPSVRELEAATGVLRERLAALEEVHTALDEEKQLLESNLLSRMEMALSGLEPLVAQHKEALREVEKRADALSASMADCQALRRRYAAWWDGVRTPLERMEEALTAQGVDASSLRATLNPGQCHRIRELNAQAQKSLEALDEILGRCVQACQQDQDTLERWVNES